MIAVGVSLRESDCCPQLVARFSFVEPKKNPASVLHVFEKGNRRLAEYKAVAMLHGHSRRRLQNSISAQDVINYKGVGHTLLSLAIPGDSDPIRSPVRSAFYRAITPGGGGRRGGSRRGENRGYRCPEGYEYGGRFTDSRLSTCGMRLFDIPGLGRMIGAALSAGYGGARDADGTPITGGPYPEVEQGRRPNIIIPKVTRRNRNAVQQNIEALVREIGGSEKRMNRLVRQDGFVLEPVVPASVLRVIPDNRNMEGATYVTSALTRNDFGRDELGMLSNSGVESIVYVMPGGSTVSLRKNRELSVGERRKLGRLVATASSKKNDLDPLAPVRYVVGEAGDYMTYEENFVGIRNPHQLVGNGTRERWVDEIFSGKRLKRRRVPSDEMRETESFGQVNSRITTVEGAIQHINNGGSLGDLSPSVLSKLLAYPDYVKRTNPNIVKIGPKKYTLEKRSEKFAAISERFAEDLQQFLGVESPDIFPVGKGDRRQFLRERPESAVVGSSINRSKTWLDIPLKDMAGLFVSDMLTDTRERNPESIVATSLGDRTFGMSIANIGAGLTKLSDIEIAKRSKMTIEELLGSGAGLRYSEYYRQLKAEQQAQLRRLIASLLQRARKFNFNQYRDRLSMSGELTDGERIHMEVLGTILKQRIRVLSNSAALRSGLNG